MAADIAVRTQVDIDNKLDNKYNCDNNSPGGVGLGGPVVVPGIIFLSMTRNLQYVENTPISLPIL